VTRAFASLPPWIRPWAADSGLLLFSQLAVIAATSTLAILIARSLTPHEWGIFSGFLALSVALAVFSEFGVGTWLMRELSELSASEQHSTFARTRAGQMLVGGSSLSASIGGVFVAATAVTAMFLGLEPGLQLAVVALVGYTALISTCGALETFFRSQRKLRRVLAATLLDKMVIVVLVALFVIGGFGITAIALAYLSGGVARLFYDVGAIVLARSQLVLSKPTLADIRAVLAASTPFAANRASLNVVPRLDAFLLALLSPAAAGYFALGDRIVGPALIVPVLASGALFPFLAREANDSNAGWRVVILFTLAGTALAGVGIPLAPSLVPFVFGSDYREAVPIVQVMLVVIPFVFASNALLAHLYSSRRERRGLTFTLAAVALGGTAAILGGQVFSGTVAAGAGYVLRQALFVASLVVAGLLPNRTVPAKEHETEGISAGGRRGELPRWTAPFFPPRSEGRP
jgi:PST family polysaccharide transporter